MKLTAAQGTELVEAYKQWHNNTTIFFSVVKRIVPQITDADIPAVDAAFNRARGGFADDYVASIQAIVELRS
jgi:hypothetical protein